MVAPLFILPHIVHLLGTDNLQSGFKCKQIMVAPISILSHIVLYCSPLSLKFPPTLYRHYLRVLSWPFTLDMRIEPELDNCLVDEANY